MTCWLPDTDDQRPKVFSAISFQLQCDRCLYTVRDNLNWNSHFPHLNPPPLSTVAFQRPRPKAFCSRRPFEALLYSLPTAKLCPSAKSVSLAIFCRSRWRRPPSLHSLQNFGGVSGAAINLLCWEPGCQGGSTSGAKANLGTMKRLRGRGGFTVLLPYNTCTGLEGAAL